MRRTKVHQGEIQTNPGRILNDIGLLIKKESRISDWNPC